jgi:hypothetical protein
MIALALVLIAALGTRAKIEASANSVQIGEPFEITFVVEHETGATVKLPEPSALPPAFALIADLGLRREIDPAQSGVTTTRARWRVMALEGGEIEFPALDIGVDGGGVNQMLHASGPKLAVVHGLRDNEDAPRPARGFRDAPQVTTAASKLTLIALGIVGVAAAYVAFRISRRKPKTAPVPATSPAALLLELERRANAEPDRAREHIFALTALVRGAIDGFVGENRVSMSDEDWIRVVSADSRVPGTSRDIAAKLLVDSERVKYAGETPSILLVRDVLAQANTALAALSPSERTAA